MTAPDIHDPFATIDPLIVFIDAHRLLLLAIRDIEGEHLAVALADGGTVGNAIERVRTRDVSVVEAMRALAADDADAAQQHLAIAMSDDPHVAPEHDAANAITSMHDAHEAFMEAYDTYDLARIDEAIAIADGTITLRHLLIEHAMREGAEAYAIASTLGRTID